MLDIYFFFQVILKIHEARSRLAKLGCFKDVGVFIDTYEGPDAKADGIEVSLLAWCKLDGFTFFMNYFSTVFFIIV